MEFTDTHTHLYDQAFAQDIDQTIERAVAGGVRTLLLPNEDSTSFHSVKNLASRYPQYFRYMAGVHPTSITTDNLSSELDFVERELSQGGCIAVGEIGLDFYWDRSYEREQLQAFDHQLSLAQRYGLPVSVHCRDAMEPTLELLEAHPGLRGSLHCFSGTYRDACRVLDTGLVLGVGGTITYKNNPLKDLIRQIGYEHIVLETDAPFLAPVPHRGRRNESAYIPLIASFLAALFQVEPERIAQATQKTAQAAFGL